jgi:hypothetical protein
MNIVPILASNGNLQLSSRAKVHSRQPLQSVINLDALHGPAASNNQVGHG